MNSNFIDNKALSEGGAVCVKYSPVFVTGSNFSCNTAHKKGGALSIRGTGGFISHCNFIENAVTDLSDAGSGGAIFYEFKSFQPSGPLLELHYSIFSGNTAVHSAGAVYSETRFNVTITNSIFINNSANSGGAIHYIGKLHPIIVKLLSLINCTFTDNTAVVRPGYHEEALSNIQLGSGGALTVKGGLRCFLSNFTRNSAELHAGVVLIANQRPYPNYFYSERCIFTNNTATGGIGGVYYGLIRRTVANIVESIFFGNTALHCGVANASVFQTRNLNTITIESSVFMYNSAVGSLGDGGVACISYGSVSINCSVFSYNTAAQNGGVIHIEQSVINIVSSSFTNNAAANDGGMMYTNHVSYMISGSHISNNSAVNNGGAIFMAIITAKVKLKIAHLFITALKIRRHILC